MVKFVTRDELLAMLDYPSSREWSKIRHKFPSVKVGRKLLYPVDEVVPIARQYVRQKRYKWWEQLPIANGD